MAAYYIWTNHARKRLGERKIPKKFIDQTLLFPDRTIRQNKYSLEIQKKIDTKTVTVLVKMNDRHEKVIISCWINPPYPGTKDHKKRQRYLQKQKASFWKKIWLTLLEKVGL